ncbi:hypothetical protein [Paraburkholderia sp. BCC1885]|uniref:hypothetical protein n=1 Tax=Paraburkholderia sp. BCC1885 TaxID=2562669 RepID=UPI0011843E94|nr:hypothetical protein [Paraburkholderia sp. BCC1885]
MEKLNTLWRRLTLVRARGAPGDVTHEVTHDRSSGSPLGRTRLGRVLLAWMALSGTSGAQAQPVSADQAPQAWVVYAQRVSLCFQTALASDDARAQRFNTFFQRWADASVNPSLNPLPASSADADHGTAPPEPVLKVRVWLDHDGRVTRIGLDPFGDDEAVASLRSLLLSQTVGAPLPRGMKQPVVVRLAAGAQL